MSSRARRSSFSTASRVIFTRSNEAANGYTWRQNSAIATATLGTASGGNDSYTVSSISPALPAGLTASFAGTTLSITGTPTAAGASATHTVIVTDTSHSAPGNVSFVEVRISVVAANSNDPVQPWIQNSTIAAFIPVIGVGGLPPYTYSIAPPLPNGLTISSVTGSISGAPIVSSNAVIYSVTVTDSVGGTGGSAVNSFTAAVTASGPTWIPSSPVPNLGYTQGTGIQTYNLAQHVTGFDSLIYKFQFTPAPAPQPPATVMLASGTGLLSIDTTNTIAVTGVSYDIALINAGTELSDFNTRAGPAIAAGGWAQRFTSATDVNNWRFTNITGWDPTPAAGTVGSFVRFLAGGGIIPGDGCLELEQMTTGNTASYWTRPFDPAIAHNLSVWPVPMTGVRGPGQEFCVQVRFKTNCGQGGGKAGNGVTLTPDGQGGRKFFSITRAERSNVDPGQVTQDTGYRGVFQMYAEHNFQPYEEGVPNSPSSDITLQPGGQFNEPGGLGYCSYQANNSNDRTDCWRADYGYPDWQTILYHVIPSSNGSANGLMEAFGWIPGQSGYVLIERKANFQHFYGEAGLTPDGFAAVIAWIYETNRSSGPANQKQWYDQIIFHPGASTIPVPIVSTTAPLAALTYPVFGNVTPQASGGVIFNPTDTLTYGGTVRLQRVSDPGGSGRLVYLHRVLKSDAGVVGANESTVVCRSERMFIYPYPASHANDSYMWPGLDYWWCFAVRTKSGEYPTVNDGVTVRNIHLVWQLHTQGDGATQPPLALFHDRGHNTRYWRRSWNVHPESRWTVSNPGVPLNSQADGGPWPDCNDPTDVRDVVIGAYPTPDVWYKYIVHYRSGFTTAHAPKTEVWEAVANDTYTQVVSAIAPTDFNDYNADIHLGTYNRIGIYKWITHWSNTDSSVAMYATEIYSAKETGSISYFNECAAVLTGL